MDVAVQAPADRHAKWNAPFGRLLVSYKDRPRVSLRGEVFVSNLGRLQSVGYPLPRPIGTFAWVECPPARASPTESYGVQDGCMLAKDEASSDIPNIPSEHSDSSWSVP